MHVRKPGFFWRGIVFPLSMIQHLNPSIRKADIILGLVYHAVMQSLIHETIKDIRQKQIDDSEKLMATCIF